MQAGVWFAATLWRREVSTKQAPSGIVVEMKWLSLAPCLISVGLPFPETMLATDQGYVTVFNLTLSGIGRPSSTMWLLLLL